VNFVRLDEYTKSLEPSGLESGSIFTLDDGDFWLCCKRGTGTCCAPFVCGLDQPSSDPTIELSKGLKNRATTCELLRT